MSWRNTIYCKAFLLFVCWPFTVLAATPLTLDEELDLISGTTWLVVLIAINIGGLASLLQKISDTYDQAKRDHTLPTPLKDQWRMIAAHVVASWFVGLIAFFGALKYGMSGLAIPVFVPVVSFGGIRMAELMYGLLVDIIRLKVGNFKEPDAKQE